MATVLDDIATELGRAYSDLSEIEKAQLQLWLTDVTDEIEVRAPQSMVLPIFDRVRRLAVAARASGPDFGVVATEVGVDDARVVTRYERSADLSLMRDEWWALLGVDTSAGAFTIYPGGI